MEKKEKVGKKKEVLEESFKLDSKIALDISFDLIKTAMRMFQREKLEKKIWQSIALLCALGTALMAIFYI